MIDAVGSNARCGSDVLMVNELSTTSVGAADERVVAPNAASALTSASVAVSGSSQAARRTGNRLTVRPPVSRELAYDPIGRSQRPRVWQRERQAGPRVRLPAVTSR